jgi:hypothetical protein
MGFHEVPWDSMRFHGIPWSSVRFCDVSVNQSVPTEANRGLTSYRSIVVKLLRAEVWGASVILVLVSCSLNWVVWSTITLPCSRAWHPALRDAPQTPKCHTSHQLQHVLTQPLWYRLTMQLQQLSCRKQENIIHTARLPADLTC